MPRKCEWIRRIICCDYSAKCGRNRKPAHLYCGCRERQKLQKMKCESPTAGLETDKQTLVDADSAADVLQYDFDCSTKTEKWTVDDPTTPFNHLLEHKLKPGADLIVQGSVLPNALSFTVNLCMREKDCIAFHFNPRLDQGYAARNSKLEGSWGSEDGVSNQDFPFVRGEPFVLEIFLTHSDFLVAVNGIHFCRYAYRTSILSIQNIEIVGDIYIKRVMLTMTDNYPSPLPKDAQTSNRICNINSAANVQSVTKCANKNTPFIGLLQKQMRSGSEIEISGTVKLLPYVFSINLQQGSSVFPHPIINLHVSVRFNQLAHAGNHVVLCNSWDHDNAWGTEEFAPRECPFVPGSDFLFRVLCRDDAFVAWVNDQPLFTFKHRFDFKKIDTFQIVGDIFVNEIKMFL